MPKPRTKLPKIKYFKGGIPLTLVDEERKYLIELLEAIDYRHTIETNKEEVFWLERLYLKMHGHKIDRTKYDMTRRRLPCPKCGREFTLLKNHVYQCERVAARRKMIEEKRERWKMIVEMRRREMGFKPDPETLERIRHG